MNPRLYFNKKMLQRAIQRYSQCLSMSQAMSALSSSRHSMLNGYGSAICSLRIFTATWKAYVPSREAYVVDHAILDLDNGQNELLQAESLWCKHFPEEPSTSSQKLMPPHSWLMLLSRIQGLSSRTILSLRWNDITYIDVSVKIESDAYFFVSICVLSFPTKPSYPSFLLFLNKIDWLT